MKNKLLCKAMVTAMLTVAVLSGCSSSPAKTGEVSDKRNESREVTGPAAESRAESESAAQTEEEIDPEVMDSIKYNIYVKTNNYIIEVLENIESYYTVVADAEEFSLLPDSGYTYKYGIVSLDSSIVDDALSVSEMEPAYDTLDPLMQQIAEPMKTLMTTFSDISHSGDFADNQYAKAKEFHTVVQANAANFVVLGYQFLDEVDIIANERVAAEEEQMKESGALIAYNSSHAITVANNIITECYNQGVDDYNLIELDLTTIKPLYDELVATVEAYNAAVADNNQLVKESLSSAPFNGLLDSLIQSVEWMIKQVESQTPIEDPTIETLGSIYHINVVLSNCIDRYNSTFAE